MISTSEMRELEARSEQHGVSRAELMETAGKAAADVIAERYPNAKTLVLAYHGNNGGDGFVVARYLSCDVWFLGDADNLSDEARANYDRLERFVHDVSFASYDVLVDALLGTGARGGLRSPLKELVLLWNTSTAAKVSLDIPTGVDPDSGEHEEYFHTNLVITFHDTKPGLREFEEQTVVVDIGVPEAACEH